MVQGENNHISTGGHCRHLNSYDVDMSKLNGYFSDGISFDSDDDGNFFDDNRREEEYDSGADLSTSPRPRDDPRDEDFGLNDEGGNRSYAFQRASDDVLGERRMVRACHSPTFARTGASAAASASTAPIINIDDSPGYGDGASPLDTGDIKRDFIVLYSGSSQTCNKKYNKEAKIDIFYDILSVEDSILLGDSPPPNLKKVCTSYRENCTKRRKWKLQDIAGTVYDLAKHIQDREERNIRPIRNSKIRALLVMYEYFTGEIARKETERQSRMDRARKSSTTSKTVRPPPSNFKYDKTMVCTYHHCLSCNRFTTNSQLILLFTIVVMPKVAEFDCPNCNHEGTVMKLHSESVLKQGKSDHERKFQKRMTEYDNLEVGGRPKKKPRRTGAPQQEYCCACNTMRTLRGCVLSGTCKLCKDNEEAGRPFDSNCTMCACTCNIGVFTESQMMDIQIKAVTRKEMNARKKEENPLKSSVDYLGVRIKSAVVDGMNSLIQSCSTVRSADILSAGAAQLSKTGMRSEEELHHLQRRLPLTTKLNASGGDVRSALLHPLSKGARHYQNRLR